MYVFLFTVGLNHQPKHPHTIWLSIKRGQKLTNVGKVYPRQIGVKTKHDSINISIFRQNKSQEKHMFI